MQTKETEPVVPEQAEDLVTHRRGGRGRILRIQRHDQDALASARDQIDKPRLDRRIAVPLLLAPDVIEEGAAEKRKHAAAQPGLLVGVPVRPDQDRSAAAKAWAMTP